MYRLYRGCVVYTLYTGREECVPCIQKAKSVSVYTESVECVPFTPGKVKCVPYECVPCIHGGYGVNLTPCTVYR